MAIPATSQNPKNLREVIEATDQAETVERTNMASEIVEERANADFLIANGEIREDNQPMTDANTKLAEADRSQKAN